MKKLYNEVIAIDIESTCWEPNKPPDGQLSDIIEFGICRINIEKKEISSPISVYVKPTTSTVSLFCEELTKITQIFLDNNGIDYLNACHRIMEIYHAKRYCFVSWGNYDRIQIQRQCLRENVPFPFGETHWNMRDMYAIQKDLTGKSGLSKALGKEGLAFVGQPHSGRDDAHNVARLFAKLVLGWENII